MALDTRFPAGMTRFFWRFFANMFSDLYQLCILNFLVYSLFLLLFIWGEILAYNF